LYHEAASAKPGSPRASWSEMADWFWDETRAGALLAGLRTRLLESEDPGLKLVARAMLVPAARAR
jgi:hypothetical protein